MFLCTLSVDKFDKDNNIIGKNKIKIACFYVAYDELKSPQFESRVFWQNKFLSECKIKDLPFGPTKSGHTQVKASLRKVSELDRPFHLMDRISVKIKKLIVL